MRSMETRLRRIDQRLREADAPKHFRPTDEDFLEYFDQGIQNGSYDSEPDAPVVASTYRQAILDAAHADPPFNPPDDFKPELDLTSRRHEWRRGRRWREVDAAFSWHAEMADRVNDGKPGVTETEFHDLAAWFVQNEARITSLDRTNLRYKLGYGPRADGVTELVERLRRIRLDLQS